MNRRRFLKTLGAAGAFGLVGRALPALADQAMSEGNRILVFHGGPIHTMENPDVTSAVAVMGNTIVARGSSAERLLLQGAMSVDLDGLCLLPGFVDCHSHWFGDWDGGGGPGNPEGLHAAASAGWTSVTEHFASPERIANLEDLASGWTPPVRLNLFLPVNWRDDHFEPWYLEYHRGQTVAPRVRVAGAKVFADGGGDWFLSEPYASDPTTHGAFFWSPDQLADTLRTLHRHRFQIDVHSMGDASTDLVLAAYAAAITGSGNSGRHRISHLAVMTDALINRLASQKTVAIPQLSWFHAGWEADMLNLLGPARLPLVGRFRDMLAAGVPFGGSTDFPYGFPEVGPVPRTLFTATTRIGEDGTPPPPAFAAQTISTAQAIASLTSHAAWAMRLEGSIGSIRPGKLADFTLLTKDPFTLMPQDLLTMEVAMTMVDGQVSYLGSAWSGLLPT